MSSASERELKIMAYADGELEGAEREEVERWLAEDTKAVLVANQMASLGACIRAGYDQGSDAKAVVSFDIADAVLAKAAAEKAPAETAKVVPFKPRPRAAVWVAATLALAAGLFLFARPKGDAPMAQNPTPILTAQNSGHAVASLGGATESVDVETSSKDVSVLYFSNENAQSTSVMVWVDESGAK